MAIKTALDETERNKLYARFQEIVHDEQPKVFLLVPQERVPIRRKFKAQATAKSPGYYLPHFELAKE